MIKSQLTECVALTNVVLTALLNSLSGPSGRGGADLRYYCGKLSTDAVALLAADTTAPFWSALGTCFNAAQNADATFAAIENVRQKSVGFAPVSVPAIAIRDFCIRFALATQAQIVTSTDFTSRQDVDNIATQIDAAFEAAETVASDSLDTDAFRALVSLRAAVSHDLAVRSRPLPRMVSYSFPSRKPSLLISQRLYGSGSRSEELVAENKPFHPLFMPASGKALSS